MTKKFSRPNTLSQEVADHISQKIVNGEYNNGDQLKILDLKDEYQASQTTIREALQMLEKTYLVENHPRRGFFVRSVQKDEMYDVWEIKKRLWSLAVHLYGKNQGKNEDVLRMLDHIVDTLISACKKNDAETVFEYNFRLSDHLLEHCGSVQVRDILTQIELQVKRFRRISIPMDDNMQETARLFDEMRNAIHDQLPEKAEKCMADFIEMDRTVIMKHLDEF